MNYVYNLYKRNALFIWLQAAILTVCRDVVTVILFIYLHTNVKRKREGARERERKRENWILKVIIFKHKISYKLIGKILMSTNYS